LDALAVADFAPSATTAALRYQAAAVDIVTATVDSPAAASRFYRLSVR
jgi:hypothetical protein